MESDYFYRPYPVILVHGVNSTPISMGLKTLKSGEESEHFEMMPNVFTGVKENTIAAELVPKFSGFPDNPRSENDPEQLKIQKQTGLAMITYGGLAGVGGWMLFHYGLREGLTEDGFWKMFLGIILGSSGITLLPLGILSYGSAEIELDRRGLDEPGTRDRLRREGIAFMTAGGVMALSGVGLFYANFNGESGKMTAGNFFGALGGLTLIGVGPPTFLIGMKKNSLGGNMNATNYRDAERVSIKCFLNGLKIEIQI